MDKPKSIDFQLQQVTSECEALKGQVRELNEKLDAKTLELQKCRKQVEDLEQLTTLMSNTVLMTFDEEKTQAALADIRGHLDKFDDYLTENFQLKRELACEKKRYVDLWNAFVEMRDDQKNREEENQNGTTFSSTQCQQMQSTIVALS